MNLIHITSDEYNCEILRDTCQFNNIEVNVTHIQSPVEMIKLAEKLQAEAIFTSFYFGHDDTGEVFNNVYQLWSKNLPSVPLVVLSSRVDKVPKEYLLYGRIFLIDKMTELDKLYAAMKSLSEAKKRKEIEGN